MKYKKNYILIGPLSLHSDPPKAVSSCCIHWPGSASCYPLTAVPISMAVVGRLVVSVLASGLVGGQGLRAGCVDSASHEHLLEVTLSVLRGVRAVLQVPFLWAACPVLMPASCSLQKPLAQHFGVLTPPSEPLLPPASMEDNQISHLHSTKSSPA